MREINDTAYGNNDGEYHEICGFLDKLSIEDRFMLWESGRMNFWRYNVHANIKPQDSFFEDNVHLWRTGAGEVVGLCISEYGRNDLFIEVLPQYRSIYPDIFRWIFGTWAAGRTSVEIDVFRGDTEKIQVLERQGFTFQCHFENRRAYDLEQNDYGYTLEEGYTVQPFSKNPDYAGRVALVQSAFNNNKYTERNIRGLMASPDYIDEYNLAVISPEQRQVAYCIGWHDKAKAHTGYIEPVGTRAGYRRQGFAKAVISECFRRMKTERITTVEISSRAEPDVANFLYDSLSPQSKREVHKYTKDSPPKDN